MEIVRLLRSRHFWDGFFSVWSHPMTIGFSIGVLFTLSVMALSGAFS